MAYQVTYETCDGSVEAFCQEKTKANAVAAARRCAKTSALNTPLGVTRWFAEKGGQSIAVFKVLQ